MFEEQDGDPPPAQVGEGRHPERNPGTAVRVRAFAVERDLPVAFPPLYPVTDVVDLATIHSRSRFAERAAARTGNCPRSREHWCHTRSTGAELHDVGSRTDEALTAAPVAWSRGLRGQRAGPGRFAPAQSGFASRDDARGGSGGRATREPRRSSAVSVLFYSGGRPHCGEPWVTRWRRDRAAGSTRERERRLAGAPSRHVSGL